MCPLNSIEVQFRHQPFVRHRVVDLLQVYEHQICRLAFYLSAPCDLIQTCCLRDTLLPRSEPRLRFTEQLLPLENHIQPVANDTYQHLQYRPHERYPPVFVRVSQITLLRNRHHRREPHSQDQAY